jgi:phosphoribosylformylglycinamidine cyclo-ligase
VLRHVEREGLLLAKGRDRRHERDDEEADAEREEEVAPLLDRRALARQRPGALPVQERSDCDRDELKRLERPRRLRGMSEEHSSSVGASATRNRLVAVEGKTYEDAGVSLAFAESVVERLRAAVESTGTTGFGAFAGLYPLDDQRLLAASMDSAGTKLVLARKARRLRGIGADLAAHCVNDVITTGAEPLFFLDYVVGHSLDMEQVAELVEGAAETCRAAGCALLGGETAEMPGVYREEELDFAGTCVGLVARDDVIDGSRVEAGDVVLGLPSVGLHTNGFSLVRGLVGDGDFDADLLLAPHKLYIDEVRELRGRADTKALAHVTGGGILGNLTRVLPEGLGVELDWDAWERPPVFAWLTERGVSEEEQRRVFNLGIGMCAVVPAADSGAGLVIGRVT